MSGKNIDKNDTQEMLGEFRVLVLSLFCLLPIIRSVNLGFHCRPSKLRRKDELEVSRIREIQWIYIGAVKNDRDRAEFIRDFFDRQNKKFTSLYIITVKQVSPVRDINIVKLFTKLQDVNA